jgi:hypothetical protein
LVYFYGGQQPGKFLPRSRIRERGFEISQLNFKITEAFVIIDIAKQLLRLKKLSRLSKSYS